MTSAYGEYSLNPWQDLLAPGQELLEVACLLALSHLEDSESMTAVFAVGRPLLHLLRDRALVWAPDGSTQRRVDSRATGSLLFGSAMSS